MAKKSVFRGPGGFWLGGRGLMGGLDRSGGGGRTEGSRRDPEGAFLDPELTVLRKSPSRRP